MRPPVSRRLFLARAPTDDLDEERTIFEWLAKGTVVFGTLLTLAFVTPLRLVLSFATMSFRAGRLLSASPFVAGLAAAWVLASVAATFVFVLLDRFEVAAIAVASMGLPYVLLWLVRAVGPR